MDPEVRQMLEAQSKKLDAIYDSAEKTRKYFLWTLIVSAVVIVLPLLGIGLLLPAAMNALTGGMMTGGF